MYVFSFRHLCLQSDYEYQFPSSVYMLLVVVEYCHRSFGPAGDLVRPKSPGTLGPAGPIFLWGKGSGPRTFGLAVALAVVLAPSPSPSRSSRTKFTGTIFPVTVQIGNILKWQVHKCTSLIQIIICTMCIGHCSDLTGCGRGSICSEMALSFRSQRRSLQS